MNMTAYYIENTKGRVRIKLFDTNVRICVCDPTLPGPWGRTFHSNIMEVECEAREPFRGTDDSAMLSVFSFIFYCFLDAWLRILPQCVSSVQVCSY